MSWTEREGNLSKVLQKLEKKKRAKNRFDAKTIFQKIKKRVVGHDLIAARISHLIENRSLRENRQKPLISLLISGPSGTGKTELSKAIAGAVFGDPDKAMCRIDCGTLGSEPSAMAGVFGSEKVFSGSSKGIIPQFVEQHEKKGGLILFDEIEKAVPNPNAPLAKALLAPLDEGRFVSAYDGRVYPAANFIIVATSNAEKDALEKITERYLPDDIPDPFGSPPDTKDMDEAVHAALRGSFADEFLNRFDFISTVTPLKDEHRIEIVHRIFEAEARSYGIEISAHDDETYATFLAEGAEQFGKTQVRGVQRWIEQKSMDAFQQAKRKDWRVVKVGWSNSVIALQEQVSGKKI